MVNLCKMIIYCLLKRFDAAVQRSRQWWRFDDLGSAGLVVNHIA